MTTRLSDLREPPVVGRYYMVPVIDYMYLGRRDTWPAIGPRHNDAELIGFPYAHWHVDVRFLTARQVKRMCLRGSVEMVAARYPLCTIGVELPAKTRLVKRRCRAASWEYNVARKRPWEEAFDEAFGKIAEPIRLRDGRLLCPHRKVDLSQFPPDADGIVTCPLHGLRVRCHAEESRP